MKIKSVLKTGISLGLWVVFAMGDVVAAPMPMPTPTPMRMRFIEPDVTTPPAHAPQPTFEPIEASVPRPPTGKQMAKFFGFPAGVKLSMKRVAARLMYGESKPIWAVDYVSEKTPCRFSVQLNKAGSLLGPPVKEEEKQLRKMMQDNDDLRREEAKEWLIRSGSVPVFAEPDEPPSGVEVRPGGRMVREYTFDMEPTKSTMAAFTTVRGYDVALIQSAVYADEYDPEEVARMKHLLYPTKSLHEAFAQMERVMPLFAGADVPTQQEAARAKQLAREAIIRAAPVPRAPTSAELEKCLGFVRPVNLRSSKSLGSFLSYRVKPLWVTSYYAEGLGSQYEVELYPARSLFGEYREWFEGWLEHPVPLERPTHQRLAFKPAPGPPSNVFGKNLDRPQYEVLREEWFSQSALFRQKQKEEEEKWRSPVFTRVETRADGRKVYFRIFEIADRETPVAFSTIGNYDVVLLQFPNEFGTPGVKVLPDGIAHHDVLQAFGELEKLFLR